MDADKKGRVKNITDSNMAMFNTQQVWHMTQRTSGTLFDYLTHEYGRHFSSLPILLFTVLKYPVVWDTVLTLQMG